MEMVDSPFGKITKDQEDVATLVAKTAREMGVDPKLAVAVAWAESRFGKNAGPSKAGAVGVMQVMPENAKPLGMEVSDLQNREANVKAGLTLLKNSLDRFGGNEILAVAGYNTKWETGEKFAKSKNPEDLPEATISYLNEIDSFRPLQKTSRPVEAAPAAPAPPAAAPPAAPPAAAPAEATPDTEAADLERRLQEAEAEQSRRMGQMFGGGTGAALTAKRVLGDVGSRAFERAGEAFASGRARVEPFAGPSGAPVGGVQPAGRVAPTAPSGGLPTPKGGTGTFNYGKAFGLTDIEAGRALDMTKQAGGAHELIGQRKEALQKLQQMFPGEAYVENPRYGGLMTPEKGVGLGPRAPYQGGAMSGQFRPPGAVGSGSPPPIPTAPKTSILDEMTQTMKNLAGPGSKTARVVGTALRYAAPPLAFAQAGAEAADIASELRRAEAEKRRPDVGYLARRGIGATGSLLSAFPGVGTLIGLPMAVGPHVYEYFTEKGGLPAPSYTAPSGK